MAEATPASAMRAGCARGCYNCESDADGLMILTPSSDYANRLRSYQLLAQEFELP